MLRNAILDEKKDSLVPGMAMYSSQNEDVDMNSDAGTANFSTNGELSQSLDRNQESTNKS